jgi:DNA-binding NarL/FixJ family response regulator
MMDAHAGPTDPELPARRTQSNAGGLSETPRRLLRVLIVEDQPFVALDCEAALIARGHEVVDIASNAQSATALAEHHCPDLILMDIRLSGSRTGLEAAIEIHRKLGIRCVFASAHADDFTRRLAEPAHPLGWLQKPFTCEEMLAVVETSAQQLGEH